MTKKSNTPRFCKECGIEEVKGPQKICDKCKEAKRIKSIKFCKDCGVVEVFGRQTICDSCKKERNTKRCINPDCNADITGSSSKRCDNCELRPFKNLLITQFKHINDSSEKY